MVGPQALEALRDEQGVMVPLHRQAPLHQHALRHPVFQHLLLISAVQRHLQLRTMYQILVFDDEQTRQLAVCWVSAIASRSRGMVVITP